MASPDFAINGGTVNVKASVTSGGSVTAIIDDISGVRQVQWSISRTESPGNPPASYALVLSGVNDTQVDTTALTPGTAAVLKAIINGGLENDVVSKATIREVKFFVPLVGNLEVLTAGEVGDAQEPDVTSSPTHGAVDPINRAILAAASSSADWKSSGRLATAGAIAAHAFLAGVITFDANGSQLVDTVATAINDRILNKEGTDLENGIYFVSTKGDGSTQEVWTRSPDADEDGEISNGTSIFIGSEGASIGVNGTVFRQIEIDPITINTTAQTWTDAGGGGGGTVTGTGTDRSIPTWDAAGTGLRDNTSWQIDASDNFVGAGANFDLDPTGTFDLAMAAAQVASIHVADNLAAAFLIQEGANDYYQLDTIDGSEVIAHGNATTNPAHNFLGSGLVTFNGPIAPSTINTDLVFASTLATPGFNQADETGAGISGDLFTTHAQDSIGTGVKSGGGRLDRAGDASGGTTDSGGNYTVRAGNGTDFGAILVLQAGNGISQGEVQVRAGDSSVIVLFDESQVELQVPLLEFDTAVTAPFIQQESESTAGVSGQPFVIHAQDSIGTGVKSGGAYLTRGGDASGGTDTGGGWDARPGAGAAGNGVLTLSDGGGTVRVTVNAGGEVLVNCVSFIDLQVGAVSRASITAAKLALATPVIGFAVATALPIIRQDDEAGAGISGDLFTTHAQNSIGTGTKSGGARLDRAGDASGGTDTGGAYDIRPGNATTEGVLRLLSGGSVARVEIDGTGLGFFGATPVAQSSAYTRNAAIVEDRTLLASASATILNNNNVLAALIADLQAIGILG